MQLESTATQPAPLSSHNSIASIPTYANLESTSVLIDHSNALSEFDLLNSARSGNKEAAAELYEKYLRGSRPIASLLRRALSDEEDRKDMLHEIYLQLLSGKHDFRGECHLGTYIFQVARFALFQKYRRDNSQRRRQAVRVILEEAEHDRSLPSEQAGPELLYEVEETRQVIRQLMWRIPPVYRQTLLLRIVEELTYQQIAALLKIPVRTVATRIYKGKKALIELFHSGELSYKASTRDRRWPKSNLLILDKSERTARHLEGPSGRGVQDEVLYCA